jgi:hypothetical protein
MVAPPVLPALLIAAVLMTLVCAIVDLIYVCARHQREKSESLEYLTQSPVEIKRMENLNGHQLDNDGLNIELSTLGC